MRLVDAGAAVRAADHRPHAQEGQRQEEDQQLHDSAQRPAKRDPVRAGRMLRINDTPARPLGRGVRLGAAVREVVRRRQAQRQRTTASTGTSRPASATGSPTTGRASPATPARSPTPSCSTRSAASRTRSRRSASGKGRPGRDLHADDPRAAGRDAGLRPHRRGALGRVRRLLAPMPWRDRINDAECKVLITADGGYRAAPPCRRSSPTPTRRSAPTAVGRARVVVKRGRRRRRDGRRARPLVARARRRPADDRLPAEPMDSEDLLYLLYTSGTTGKPKGIMHTTGGYLTQVAYTHGTSSTSSPRPTSTGARPTSAGSPATATSSTGRSRTGRPRSCTRARRLPRAGPLVADRRAKYGVTILYTAPTAIRAFMKWGDEPAPPSTTCRRCGCSAASASRSTPRRGCGTTSTSAAAAARSSTPGGRPRPAHDHDHARCPASPRPSPARHLPAPRHRADVVDEQGEPSASGGGGYLVLDRPWPAMLRGIWGDPERYRETYWSRFPGRTSPATAPSATRTATSGCSAASTT
jgi:hypothetical protein